MLASIESRSSHAGMGAVQLRQSLLSALAKIDFEHQSDIETVTNSSADKWLKQATIRTLEERHRQRRAPYIRQLERLQRRTQAFVA